MEINLPPYEIKLREQNGRRQIFDFLRRRYVSLTPEEWVRQHFVHFLIGEKGFSQALMGNEVQLTLN
ncbi:MAG: type I restriction enzyme HsdR N-terminal domain-containing protein, partial [Alphaproteobacteria bacterium]|nr:type I restriction enzyme HsdR N-terminal domain-containing protein [Alphaproteobacteria bacterium]